MEIMQKKIVAVVLLAILLCSAFLLGMAYQKTQPVKVDVIAFTDGNVVKTQTFLHTVDMGQTTFLSDRYYRWDKNVSFYAIVIHSI